MRKWLGALLVLALPVSALAQAAPPAAAAPAAGATTAAATPASNRISWFSDRRPLRVGDILTIVVDEGINSRDQQTNTATDIRSQDLSLNANVSAAAKLGPVKGFGTSANATSRADGIANRDNTLATTISVRVTSIEPSGNAKIEGEKTVDANGSKQLVKVSGLVRPEDVGADNLVSSARIADAVITYKGKKISPKKGILGGILSIFWP